MFRINIPALIIIIVITSIITGVSTCEYTKLKNQIQSKNQIIDFYKGNKKIVELKKKEFKKLIETYLDSSTKVILKENNIKLKNIISYQNSNSITKLKTNIYYKDSTVIINDTIKNNYKISQIDSPYFKIRNVINLDSNKGKFSIEIPDTIQTFIYFGKRNKSFLGIFRYGNRVIKDTIINKNPYVFYKKNITIIKK